MTEQGAQPLGSVGKVQVDAAVLRELRQAGVPQAEAFELARLDALGDVPAALIVLALRSASLNDPLRLRLAGEARAAFDRAADALLPEAARVAAGYIRRGWCTLPVPFRQKAPRAKAWQTWRFQVADIRAVFSDEIPHNVGVQLGEPSGGLVDVDLDSPEALALAPAFLPRTGAVFGRPGKRRAHWLYRIDPPDGLPSTTRYQDAGAAPGDKGACLVELRSTGGQTIFPGSTHPSGELIDWDDGGEPAAVVGRALARAVATLAAASLLARHWPAEGARHDTALAVGALLARAGWWEQDAADFVARAARTAGDPEAPDRARAVADSFATVRTGKAATGWKRLADLIGSRPADRLRTWLKLDADEAGGSWEAERRFDHPLLEAMEAASGLPPEEGPPASRPAVLYDLTDVGNAERLVAASGADLRYCAAWRSWLCWDGRRWLRDETGAVLRLAIRAVRGIRAEARATEDDERAGRLRKWATDSQQEARLQALLKIATALSGIAVRPDELDACPHLLNCPDGTVDLRTGLRHAHRREELLTKLTPASGDMDAPAPVFDAFLLRIIPDEGVRSYLQRMAGQTLVGDETERVLPVLFGPGRNGKSTLIEAMLAALGPDYARVTPPETLLDRREGTIPNDLAMLKGVRLVAVSETEQDQHLAEALVKRMTGGDTISARHMRGEWFDFKPQFTPWLATNYRPTVRGDDQGIWDRIRLTPLAERLADDEVDRQLPLKLRAELAGILGWMLRGCVEWRIRGLCEPDTVRTATAQYREQMDVVGRFLADCCDQNPQAIVPARQLFAEYQSWCGDTGERAMSQRWLGIRLADRGYKSLHTRAGSEWAGLSLRKP